MSLGLQQQIQILHIDDDPSLTDLTRTFLEREDDRFTVETATSADEGLERIDDRPPDCVVSDYNMPGMDGLEFLQAVREDNPDLPFILYTGKGSEAVASEAIAADVTDYLQKGSSSEQYELLANRIRNAVEARRETQRAEKQEQLMRLTEFAGDTGGFELDTETGEILMTDGARRINDIASQADLSIDEAIDLYHPEDRGDIRQTIDRTRQTGEQTRGTWRTNPQAGDERLLSVTFTPATTDGGTEILRGSIHDITDQHERQQELEKERRFITQALDALDDLFYVIDTDGTLRRWNEKALEITGYSESELDGLPAIELFPEDEREAVSKSIETTLTDGEARINADLLTEDGQRIPYELTGGRLTDGDGNTTGLVGIGRDLTEHRQRERRFRALVEESNDVISIVDADGRYQYQSLSLERILGHDPEETVGSTAWEYIHPDDYDTVIEKFQTWVANPDQQTEVVEYRARDADGSWHWMEAEGNDQLDNPAVEGYIINSRDITARKEREQELIRQRQRYTSLFETLPNPVLHARVEDGEPVVKTINPAFENTFGYDADTIRDEPLHDYILPDDQADAVHQLNRQVLTGGDVQTEVRRKTPEDVRSFRLNVSTRNTDTGEHEGYAVYTDITEQRELEAELSAILDRISDAFFALDEEFRFTHINGRAEELLEASEDQLLGETPWDVFPDTEESDKVFESLRAAMDTQTPQSRELHYELRNDWFESTVYPSESGVSVYFQDVTENKNREQELQDLKNQYETLAENFPDGAVYLIDRHLECVRAGGKELSKVGLSPNDVEGTKPHDLFPEDIAGELRHYYEKALDGTANTFQQEYEGDRYRIQTVPVRTDDEEVDQVMAVSQNITEHSEDKRNLERQNERLEEFASIVSHDLRSPLSVAAGRLELAQETCESDHLARAADAVDRSQALIDDLLTLAREGQKVAEVEPVGLADVVENSWQTVETERATLETDVSQVVRADESRLQQLFENLYRNAVEHGGEDLTVSVGATDEGFYVADTGPGIPKSEREEIFEAGYSTSEEGTGFGLRIVEQIADAQGWAITVTRSGEGGVRFDITGVEFADH